VSAPEISAVLRAVKQRSAIKLSHPRANSLQFRITRDSGGGARATLENAPISYSLFSAFVQRGAKSLRTSSAPAADASHISYSICDTNWGRKIKPPTGDALSVSSLDIESFGSPESAAAAASAAAGRRTNLFMDK
jgi:hypothetical protein